MASYENPWHPTGSADPKVYETSAPGQKCGPYIVYQRVKGVCWDFVIDGVVVSQRAGFSNQIPTGPHGLPQTRREALALRSRLLEKHGRREA